MAVIESIVNFLGRFANQLLFASMLFAPALAKRRYFWVRLVIGICLYCSFPYMLTGFGRYRIYANPYLYVGWLNLNWLAVLVAEVLLMLFVFKIKISEALFYSTSAYAMQHFIRKIAMIIVTAFGLSGIWRSFVIMASAAILPVFYFVFARRIRTREILGIKPVYTVTLSLIIVAIVYVLSVFVGREGERTVYSGNIYAASCSILLLIIQFGLFEQEKRVHEKFEIEKMLHEEREVHRLSRENIEFINIKCHDLKHQIAAIRNLKGDEQEVKLKEIENAIMIYDSMAKTGNDTVDLVISEKSLQCEKYGIKFSYMVEIESLSVLDEIDLYSLLGNALSNAIEASVKVDDVRKRTISLKIARNGDLICLHIENYTEAKIAFKDGLPVTTKGDERYHGYGMKSIKYIVEKYKGHMKVEIDDNIFSLDAIIPV